MPQLPQYPAGFAGYITLGVAPLTKAPPPFRHHAMSITLEEIEIALTNNGFNLTETTTKLVEYRSTRSGRILYVYKEQGFPDHADVIVHPDADATTLLAIPGVQGNRRVAYRFGSNMTSFPTRLNKGVEPEHFGRALYVFTSDAMAKLCRTYGA